MLRLRWTGAVGGILLLSYFLRIGFFTYALYVVLLLLLIARFSSLNGLRGVTHVRHCEVQRARLGEQVEMRLAVRHTGKFPIVWLLAEDLTPAALPRFGECAKVASLWPNQGFTLTYRVDCVKRGYHQLGPLLLETGDLFGLVRRFEAGDKAHYLTVHPETVPVGSYDLASPRPIGEVRVERRVFEDPSLLRGVREYQPGDKLSRIHWRSSARTGTLQTKVYEPTTMIGALICLDLYQPAYQDLAVEERSELAVVCAASLASYISNSNQQTGFITNGRDAADRARYDAFNVEAATRWQAMRLAQMREDSDRLRPFEVAVGRGPVTLQRILDATARAELSDFQSLGAMLMREYPRLPRDVTLLLLTPRIDRALVEACTAMRRSGFVLSVLVVGNSIGYLEGRGQLLAERIPTYDIQAPHHLRELAAVRL